MNLEKDSQFFLPCFVSSFVRANLTNCKGEIFLVTGSFFACVCNSGENFAFSLMLINSWCKIKGRNFF